MTGTGTGTALRPVTPLDLLTARLDDVSARLCAVEGLDPALRRDLDQARDLAAGLGPYLAACTTPESPALRRLAELTVAADWTGDGSGDRALEREMLSGHLEGQLLKVLVHATRARRVLEIGMFTGYSALAMAEALPVGGEVVACELDAEAADFARRCFAASPAGDLIDVRVGPALATLRVLAEEGARFDLVFIDADKAGYTSYLEAVLGRSEDAGLLAPGGLVCVDNTLMQGQPYGVGELSANGAAIAAFNRVVAADPRVEQVLVPLRDGVTLIRRTDPDAPV
ncbi:hypothetical protein BH11ACT8_BH11ACT8_22030 [soil metagenome]